MTVTDLVPIEQKSFYGKAKIIMCDDGWVFLKSYNTIVAAISPDGEFKRLSSVKSGTTSRHIKAFLSKFCDAVITPREFYSWPVTNNPHGELDEEQ